MESQRERLRKARTGFLTKERIQDFLRIGAVFILFSLANYEGFGFKGQVVFSVLALIALYMFARRFFFRNIELDEMKKLNAGVLSEEEMDRLADKIADKVLIKLARKRQQQIKNVQNRK